MTIIDNTEIDRAKNKKKENRTLKVELIIMSYLPLFFILFCKYFDIKKNCLFIQAVRKLFVSTENITINTAESSFLWTIVLETVCCLWMIASGVFIIAFDRISHMKYTSQGEILACVSDISDSSPSFFMTYVAPMVMDDLDSPNGLLAFAAFMVIIIMLMWKTNLYYQNPIITILGFKIYSFKFEETKSEFKDVECIAISKEKLCTGKPIKRQWIADNVFIIKNELGYKMKGDNEDGWSRD